MRIAFTALLVCGAMSLGCSKAADTSTAAKPAEGGAAAAESSDSSAADAPADATEEIVEGIKIGPDNAKIGFVGKHAGAEPNPRTGGFERFEGVAELTDDGKSLKSVTVEIEADSLWTQFGNLTNHLNSEDFLDTRAFPTASFKSTKIEPGAKEGEVNITGELTLHGVTREITFPATVSVTDGKVDLKSNFVLKRSEFGMDKKLEGVIDDVDLEIVLGEKTEKLPEQAGPG